MGSACLVISIDGDVVKKVREAAYINSQRRLM